MRSLVWLRADLRLHDQPALAAARDRGEVVAVFLAASAQWRRHDWGAARVGFLRRRLGALSGELAVRRIPLRILEAPRFDDAPACLLALAREIGATALAFNRELEVNEARRDRLVTAACREAGIEVASFDDQTIVAPGEVTTGSGEPYRVFTPFWRRWVARVEAVGFPALRAAPAPQERAPCASDPVPESFGAFPGAPDRPDLWPAGEGEAERRLEQFVAGAARRYAERRDLVAERGTSGLSPYLAAGALSPRAWLSACLAANEGRLEGGDPGLAAHVRQIGWREFYRHVLVGFPRVSRGRAFLEETESIDWRHDPDDLAAWRSGRTGVPIVDAGLRQLGTTGWMHNRVRMITAMFLTKQLLVDWREGERHFMRSLVDGDLANNNGGWQWSASTGTDAAPYFRIMNPWTQARRYDPDGVYVRRFVPELAEVSTRALVTEGSVEARRRGGYPEPIVDHREGRERALVAFRKERSGR